MIPRIGGVPYGVGAPLLAGMAADPAVAFTAAPPTGLIAGLRSGALDAALVSSVEAVRQPGYRVVPDLGIACKREIRSVRAFRRPGVPIRSVAMDQSSATSVALLQLLLREPYRDAVAADLQLTTIAPTRQPDQLPQDLVLLIGDDGLAAEAGDREVWDLGREWQRWTGLPFVFAVWLLRPAAPLAKLLPALRRARRLGAGLGAVDGTFGAAHYELDDDDRRGLLRFWSACRQHGLADQPDPPWASG